VFNQNRLPLVSSMRVLLKTPSDLSDPLNTFSTLAWQYDAVYLPFYSDEQRFDQITLVLAGMEKEFRREFRIAMIGRTR